MSLSPKQLAILMTQNAADHATNSEGASMDAKRAIDDGDHDRAKSRLSDAINEADAAKMYAEMALKKIESLSG